VGGHPAPPLPTLALVPQERLELHELRDLFELIDADGDGRITTTEVVAAARAEPRVAALLASDSLP
jgi:hypothetical protein